jgi:alkanesulfonate monooxygenase SsuD/methylene tetrahydromethanopterin reductase-like flavin-dependent oxidoreductase (luciferase family)
MRYALNLPIGGVCADPRVLAEFASVAEAAGWDAVLLEDYVVYQGHQDWPTCDPWIALAAMALRTERIRVGTEVTALPRRRPWKLARETVTLDHLSGGRLTLCVGLGDLADPGFSHLGEVTGDRQRAQLLDEGLDVLVDLWTGEPFAYTGEQFQVQEITFLPRPVQVPRIPIWVGGELPRQGPLRRAARWDGACLFRRDAHQTEADVRQIAAVAADQRAAGAPFDIVVGGLDRTEDWDRERATIKSLEEAGATWWLEWIRPAEYETMRAAVQRGPLRSVEEADAEHGPTR